MHRSSLPFPLAAAVLAAALLLVVPFAGGQSTLAPAERAGVPQRVTIEAELPDLRTERSRTYELEDGRRLSKVFAGPVHHRANGEWRTIDTRLEPAAGGFAVKDAGYRLSVPSRLGDAGVKVADGANALSFSLEGARAATAEVRGATVRYPGAVEGAALTYTAQANGVKEALILDGPSSPATYSFDLRASDGLRPRADGSGGLEFADRDGDVKFSIAPAYMRDAAGAVSHEVEYDVDRAGDARFRLTMRADRDWLADPGRRYPVELDPSVFPGPQRDCGLAQATPTTSLCAAAQFDVGWNGTHDHRAILKFDLAGVVPDIGQVEDSWLATYLKSRTTANVKQMAVHRMTRDWTTAATWNTYNGTNAWTTAGGDFDATRNYDASSLGTNSAGFVYWGVTPLARDWATGAQPNYGLVLKDRTNASVNNKFTFASAEDADPAKRPYLGLIWNHRTGEPRHFTLHSEALNDRMRYSVNVANRGLTLLAADLRIKGTGMDLAIGRAYNMMYKTSDPRVGTGWQLTAGMGVRLQFSAGDSRLYVDPTGGRHLFVRQDNGSFATPTAVDGKLVEEANGEFKLSFDRTKESYRFNADGDLIKHEDKNGNAITYAYSAAGKLSSATDTQGRQVTVTYDAAGRVQKLTDSTARTWTYGYDTSGRLTTYTDPELKVTKYVYDQWDNLIEVEDPRGKVTRFEYDAQGVTQAKRGYNRTTAAYVARTQFASSGVASPCTSAAPESAAGKSTVTDPRGNVTTYCFDRELRVKKAIDAKGHQRSKEYTANSDVSKFTNGANGSVTNLGWDTTKNNLSSVSQQAGEQNSFAYTSAANPNFPTQHTNPQGTTTLFAYSNEGNLQTTTNGASPTQIEASLKYNGDGSSSPCPDTSTRKGTMKCAIDGNGRITKYEYDAQGNLTKVVPPTHALSPNSFSLNPITYTYDALSRIKTEYDGVRTNTFTYDKLDRVKSITVSAPTPPSVTYTYDDNGNLTARSHPDGGASYVYDDLNRRTKDTFENNRVNDYGYDAASNLTSLTDAGGTVNYSYDQVNRLEKLQEPGGNCAATPATLCTVFTYTARDRLDEIRFPNGVIEKRTYDGSDKPALIEAKRGTTVLTRFAYDYVNGTRQTQLRQSVTDKDNNKTSYTYDQLERLKSAVVRTAGGTGSVTDDRSWEYDKAGNRTKQVVNGATTSYHYNEGNQLCWRASGTPTGTCASPPAGSTVHTYDHRGNELDGTNGRVSGYTIKNQVTQVVVGATTHYFGYRSFDNTERVTVSGTWHQNNLLGVGWIGSTYWSRANDGSLITQRAGTAKHYYLKDALGSVVGLTDSAGAVTDRYNYDAYGNLLTSSSGSNANPWRFAGQHREAGGTFMYKMGARYYDPSLGRWTQQDQIDQAGDLREGNRYVYTGDDPVNRVDPSGRFSLDINGSIGSGIGIEFGVEIDEDYNVSPYVGGGGGIGGGGSVSASFGESDDGISGGGCFAICFSSNDSGGFSVGAGYKASAGIYYREYLW
jgi:RHS repeat-associated protein